MIPIKSILIAVLFRYQLKPGSTKSRVLGEIFFMQKKRATKSILSRCPGDLPEEIISTKSILCGVRFLEAKKAPYFKGV
jgi:hypothetical protein